MDENAGFGLVSFGVSGQVYLVLFIVRNNGPRASCERERLSG